MSTSYVCVGLGIRAVFSVLFGGEPSPTPKERVPLGTIGSTIVNEDAGVIRYETSL